MTRTIERTPTTEELRKMLRETQEYADKVLAGGNLAEKLEPYFEAPPELVAEGRTLASYVSDSLVPVMPKISPELFELTREANVPLTDEQKRKIIKSLFERGFRYKDSSFMGLSSSSKHYEKKEVERFSSIADVKLCGEIPLFFYGQHSDSTVKGVDLRPEISFRERRGYDNFSEGFLCVSSLMHWMDDGTFRKPRFDDEDIIIFDPSKIKKEDHGKFSLDLQAKWEAPYRLDVSAKVPEVPEGFIELGDEAIATYYDFARQAPKELRGKTSLQTPSIGILWAPTDESLYATGKIPEPKRIPLPRHDPAIVLDIPDGENHYRHIVATWDIGEELPFRNWLAEYTEKSGRPNLRILEKGKK